MAPRTVVVSAPTALAKRKHAAQLVGPVVAVLQQAGQHRRHEAVAGAGGIHGIDREAGHVQALIARVQGGAARPVRHDEQLRALAPQGLHLALAEEVHPPRR